MRQALEPLLPNLPPDIAAENRAIMSSFPDSVDLKFVLYNHSGNGKEQADRIAPHIIGARVVALEFYTAEEGLDLDHEARVINTLLSQGRDGDFEKMYADVETSELTTMAFSLASFLTEQSIEEMPTFAPVDVYNKLREIKMPQQIPEHPVVESAYKSYVEYAWREGTVLRQAHELAVQLDHQKGGGQIAIAQGAVHWETPRATQALDIRTQTVMVDEPDYSVVAYLRHTLRRTNDPVAVQSATRDAVNAETLGNRVAMLRNRLNGERAAAFNLTPQERAIVDSIGVLCLEDLGK